MKSTTREKVAWSLTFVISLLEKETLVLPEREEQTNSWMGAGGAKCFTSNSSRRAR